MKRLLIVDDEVGGREALRMLFRDQYQTETAADAQTALAALERDAWDLMLLDVIMPGQDGLWLLKQSRMLYPELPVVMVSASTSIRGAVEAIQSGACDYVTKPYDAAELRQRVATLLEAQVLRRRVTVLEEDISATFPVNAIVGADPGFRQALEHLRKAAEAEATVLITGETGVGKELAARVGHALSPRCHEPFVPVHCAALPETLMESELFGHEKGAFTQADRRKLGRFDLAGAGTLFFDEVSEMSLATQVKLLRVLQEREYMRVGGTQVIRTRARIMAATARSLPAEVAAGRFREDLFYRLNVIPVALPALRARPADVPLLAKHFLGQLRVALNARLERIAPDALACLQAYAWPGNVRELRNLIERILVLHGTEPELRAEFLPPEVRGNAAGSTPAPDSNSLPDAVAAFERRLIMEALAATGGNQTQAARQLGLTRRMLKYRMDRLQLEVGQG